MVVGTGKLSSDYFRALERVVGAFHKSIDRIYGSGVFKFYFAAIIVDALHADDPYGGPQRPAGATT